MSILDGTAQLVCTPEVESHVFVHIVPISLSTFLGLRSIRHALDYKCPFCLGTYTVHLLIADDNRTLWWNFYARTEICVNLMGS